MFSIDYLIIFININYTVFEREKYFKLFGMKYFFKKEKKTI